MLEHRHLACRYQEHHAPELHEALKRNFKKIICLPPVRAWAPPSCWSLPGTPCPRTSWNLRKEFQKNYVFLLFVLEHRHHAGRYQEHHAPELHETLERNFKKTICLPPVRAWAPPSCWSLPGTPCPRTSWNLRKEFQKNYASSSCSCLSTAIMLVATRNTMPQNFMKP